MDQTLVFKAPWSQSLTYITVATCLTLILGIGALIFVSKQMGNVSVGLFSILIVLIAVVSAVFMVRGYEIAGDRLLISRLGWTTEIALNNLESAVYDPTAMDKSLRIFGNGGFFSFVGKFRTAKLGVYDAYVTAPRLAVVLKLGKKTIMVSPEKPEEFVTRILSR
ncbi:MAG: hypothetical protein HC799_01550 [Limnothrix sp. RL_2_0]|nr:hypothetical protein [Limnothrix sp. RL_2_0]